MEEMTTKANAMAETYGAAPALDLSKVKNLSAAKSKGSVSSEIEKKVESSKKSKFCFIEEHEFNLPSNGFLYKDAEDEDIRRGVVRLRPMTLADEQILSNQAYIKNGSVFRRLINSCILNNFDAKDFVSYDMYYIIYALRQITYGMDYNFEVACPECENTFNHEMLMSEVEFDEITEEVETTRTIKLPSSKYTVSLRYGTIGDEETMEKYPNKNNYSELAVAFSIKTTEVLDEKGEPINPKDYPDFYEAIPAKDRVEIAKFFTDISNVLKIPEITCTCPNCGYENKMEVPFSKDFFRY